jgi:hypothetical protein
MNANFFAFLVLALFAGCGNPTETETPDTGVEADADTDADADGDTDADVDTITITFEVTVPNAQDWYAVDPPSTDPAYLFVDGKQKSTGTYYQGETFTFAFEGSKDDHLVEFNGGGITCAPFTTTDTTDVTYTVTWEPDQCRFYTAAGTYDDGEGHQVEVGFGWDDLDEDGRDEATILFMDDWAVTEGDFVPEVPAGGTIDLERTLEDMTWTGPTGADEHLHLVDR